MGHAVRRAFALLVLLSACYGGGRGCDIDLFGECTPETRTVSGGTTFEDCDEDLCGAIVSAGSARITSTWHPAEHALEIDPGSRVVLASPLLGEFVSVSVLWQCRPGGRLFVQGTELAPSRSGLAERATVDLVDWSPPGDPAGWERGRVPIVRVEGSESCWIDDTVTIRRVEVECRDWWDEDAGPPDAGPSPWHIDAGPPDSGATDGGSMDAGTVDDAGLIDASSDAAATDAAATVDADAASADGG